MNKMTIATLAAVLGLGLGTSGAFAQEASGAMSNSEMASGTMAKQPMAKKKHTPAKKNGSMGMKHEASGAMGN
ncbi:pentapeptide MXKDX repeat protein [Trinickia fusca]|uniref:Pentapeptide MXKDX repeat protein n=1 Tax=Trinickia fusca TaxID=2419777 RepID=A0A494XII6_9BURK|nr:pentapeptide MXKDX repeat protein [Trinickia fusca]RKP50555.1 pentapeptide MXKDX repeat protein [Trinickia fusca]